MEKMIQVLNKVKLKGAKLLVTKAKFKRDGRPFEEVPTVHPQERRQETGEVTKTNTEDKPYRDILTGAAKTSTKTFDFHDKESLAQKEWSKKSLLVEAKDLNILCNLMEVMKNVTTYFSGIRYVGGLKVLLSFFHEHHCEAILTYYQAKPSKWFSKVIRWSGQDVPKERIAWLRIDGVPLQAWDEEIFNKIGSYFGEIVYSPLTDWKDRNLAYELLGVLVSQGRVIEEEVKILWQGKRYRVWVSEIMKEWVPDFLVGPQKLPAYLPFPAIFRTSSPIESPVSEMGGGLEEGEVDQSQAAAVEDPREPNKSPLENNFNGGVSFNKPNNNNIIQVPLESNSNIIINNNIVPLETNSNNNNNELNGEDKLACDSPKENIDGVGFSREKNFNSANEGLNGDSDTGLEVGQPEENSIGGAMHREENCLGPGNEEVHADCHLDTVDTDVAEINSIGRDNISDVVRNDKANGGDNNIPVDQSKDVYFFNSLAKKQKRFRRPKDGNRHKKKAYNSDSSPSSGNRPKKRSRLVDDDPFDIDRFIGILKPVDTQVKEDGRNAEGSSIDLDVQTCSDMDNMALHSSRPSKASMEGGSCNAPVGDLEMDKEVEATIEMGSLLGCDLSNHVDWVRESILDEGFM